MNAYADDLATLVEALDLRNAIHVGHSTGGGEVARYLGRHGSRRVAKAALISAVPPLMPKTAANPGGTPIATSTKPPLRIQVGTDCLARVEAKLAEVASELAAWRTLAESTDCEPTGASGVTPARAVRGVSETFG